MLLLGREVYCEIEDGLKQSGIVLSNQSFDMVINQIHNSEQQSPFSPKDDESGSSILSSHSRNYVVKRLMSSSQKLMLYVLATMSLSFYEWMD